MANEAETAIYNRLAAAPVYHPSSASLFAADWGLEPGDIVTVKSGSTDYSVPVYSMDLNWKGSSKVDIQSSGNMEREPLPELKRSRYGSGSSAYRTQIANEEQFSSIITKTGINELGENETLYSQIYQEAGRIDLIVQNIGSDGTVTAASIALAITNAGSNVTISADHITLDGTTSIGDLFTQYGQAFSFFVNRIAAVECNFESMEFGPGGEVVSWKDIEVVTDIDNGTPVKETIYYLGRTVS